VVTPFREEKGSVYEGGIRVPGLIEWPAKIKKGRVSKVNGVTSDMLPTLCEWAGMELPKRPLDGISLAPLVEGKMKSRPKPIGFWSFNTRRATRNGAKPYFTAEEQQGTTPLVKFMGNIRTRNFRNYHQPPIEGADYGGARVWLDNRYKLVIPSKADGTPELYDLQTDPAEETNIAKKKPELSTRLARELRTWQSSVLNSLREKDYPKK
jgi:arylsulfatase A-like enzyme